MFVDRVTIDIKAGDGGPGAVSFRREKYVAKGGPDGGHGGKGGNVVLIADPSMLTLMDFRYQQKYFAQNGEKGGSNNCFGADGKDCVIKVPVGTVVRTQEGKVVADLIDAGKPVVLLKGGVGGKGNTAFATPVRKAPAFAQGGIKTPSHKVVLELKTLADVGLIGYPNAGKSTFLAAATRANPKIANYPFTTLHPNLGVARVGDFTFVLADIPGLIEGAHEGHGLGHEFLRHIERTRLLIHVVDVAGCDGRDPVTDFEKINEELVAYQPELAQRPQLVVANKMDIPDGEAFLPLFQEELQKKDITVYPVSAVSGEGVLKVLQQAAQMLAKMPVPKPIPVEEELLGEDGPPFTIEKDEDGVYCVSGPLTRKLMSSINLSDRQSFDYFQRMLRDKGILDALRQAGVQDGDTVAIEDFVFDFVE